MKWGKTYAQRHDALMKKREGHIRFAWWPLRLFTGRWVWWEPVWAKWIHYHGCFGGGGWIYEELRVAR